MITSPDTSSSISSPPDQTGDRVGDHPPAGTCSIKDAAARLGVSVNTIRRWIREGRLRTERIARPQGYVVYVHLPKQVLTHEQLSEESREHHVPEQVPIVQDLARAEAMAAYTRSLLEPLVARMAEQEGVIRDLERENGRLTAELAAATATPSKPEPVPNPFPAPNPPAPNAAPWDARWQARVTIAAAVLSVLALAMSGASAWVPRLVDGGAL